jgi:hypothetical protein
MHQNQDLDEIGKLNQKEKISLILLKNKDKETYNKM